MITEWPRPNEDKRISVTEEERNAHGIMTVYCGKKALRFIVRYTSILTAEVNGVIKIIIFVRSRPVNDVVHQGYVVWCYNYRRPSFISRFRTVNSCDIKF